MPRAQSTSTAQGPWMSLVGDYLSVLIHRPGLTFDPAAQPFSECLEICTSACSRVIRSAISLGSSPCALDLGAALSSLAFQCALMIVFNHCHTSRENAHKDDVIRAMSFLAQCERRPAFADSHQLRAALSDGAALLRSLSLTIDRGQHATAASTDRNAVTRPALTSDEGMTLGQMQMEAPASMFSMDVDYSGLVGLGQLDSLDWIFDFNPDLPSASG